jgi:hypothetical protein
VSARATFGGALLAAVALAGLAAAADLRATGALLGRLRAAGRAEARLEGRLEDPLAGTRTLRGRLSLEPPDRVRIDLDATGERITCRADGGEWLQPALGQLVLLGPGRVAPLLEWWSLLLGDSSARFSERAQGGGRHRLVPREPAGVDTVWVTLGRDRLPARIETRAGDVRATWRLSAWRFPGARGRAAFVLAPPPGIEVVPLD